MEFQQISNLRLLATTNTPPSPHEATCLREVTTRLEGQLDNLKGDILRLDGQLQLLKYNVGRLESELDFIRPISSLIRRLPPEIIGEIFSHLPPTRRNAVNTYQNVVRTLCLVCKAWRDAVQSLPRLWSTLVLEMPMASRSLTSESITTWFNRAKGIPKVLSFSANECAPWNEEGDWEHSCKGAGLCAYENSAVASFLKNGPPLHTLALRFTSAACFRRFSTLVQSIQTSNPWIPDSLSHVYLDIRQWKDRIQEPQQSLFAIVPPSVKSLRLLLPSCNTVEYDDISLNTLLSIPISNSMASLTVLNISTNFSADHIFKIIVRCVVLESLDLSLWLGDFGYWDEGDPWMAGVAENGLILPSLRSLQLRQVPLDALGTLGFLKCPILRELSIMFGREEWTAGDSDVVYDDVINARFGPSFAAFLRGDPNCPPMLQRLHLQHGIFEGNTLFDTLQPLSSITHLTLENIVFDKDLFTKLSTPTRSLPQLKVMKALKLQFEGHHQVIRSLQAFARSRSAELWMSPEMWDEGYVDA